MRLHRFYIEELNNNPKAFEGGIPVETLEINDSNLVNQIRNVFRYKVGDEIIVFGGGCDYLCSIINLNKNSMKISKIEERKNISRKPSLYFAVSLPKKDKFELIVEKLSEIGVTGVFPIISDRTEKTGIQMNRLNRISIEATEQSGQNTPMLVADVMKLDDFIEYKKAKLELASKHYLDFGGDSIFDVKEKILTKKACGVIIFVGPEGGWSDADKEIFKSRGITPISLGESVLRTETATIVAGGILAI